MKGLKEMTGTAYMPVIVNEVRAIVSSEALMYSTDQHTMLRKPPNEAFTYVDLNNLYSEMSEKMPSFVKIMDFVKHATATGKRQRDVYSHERREAIVASIMAKAMCTFNSKLDAYKVQLSSLLLNNGSSGEFELDLLAETNDTYPFKQKKRFVPRTSDGSKNDLVIYKDNNGKCKMINLYDLVKYDPADGADADDAGDDAADCPIDTASVTNQQPFLLLSKPGRVGSRKRKGVPKRTQLSKMRAKAMQQQALDLESVSLDVAEQTIPTDIEEDVNCEDVAANELASQHEEAMQQVEAVSWEEVGEEEVCGDEDGGEVGVAPDTMELAMAVISGDISSGQIDSGDTFSVLKDKDGES